MANKLYEMQKLTADVSRDVAASPEEWMKFLDTAARLYRYTFPEQLLIYAQRPEATAVASMEIWNKRMYRWINRGSRGIALIDNTSGPRMKLRYVFDIQDTHKVKNLGRDPKLWEMIPAGEQLSAEYLQNQFSLEEVDGGLAETLRQAARESVQEWLPDAFDELLLNVPDTYLEELDEQNQRVEFQELMENSTWYVLLKRSGLDVKEYLGDEDFQKITDFNELKVMVHLGTAVNEICRPILMQLGRYVLTELENDLETVAKEKEVVYNEFSTLIRESNNITEDDNRQEKRRISSMKAITYSQNGSYQIPDISMKESSGMIGKYGMMRREYLRNHKIARFNLMTLQGTLDDHLAAIDSEARQKVEDLTEQLLQQNPAPNKMADGLAWTRHMNQTRAQAEELVIQEVIYS